MYKFIDKYTYKYINMYTNMGIYIKHVHITPKNKYKFQLLKL